jgi:beta-glucuronidase
MRQLANDDGVYFIMGDFLGAYTLGSQANWEAGTDYTDPDQRQRMLKVLKDMVLDHKDEPYVLMWLLGNENQHPHTHTNAYEFPEAYARFLNDAAAMVHELDPDHPVAVCNLNYQGMKEIAQFAPEVDIYGANVYSGAYSMGSVWHQARVRCDRAVMITEMGCDVWSQGKGLDEDGQAGYFEQNWRDIRLNAAGAPGEGNAIGGIFFEWMDEWWKSGRGDAWGDPNDHNTESDFIGPFPDGNMNEEWLGIFGQGSGKHSPYLREPRKIYDSIRRAWTSE